MLGRTRNARCWMLTTALGGPLIALVSGGGAAADDKVDTATPIKHVIILIAENRTFDYIYGMYQPARASPCRTRCPRGSLIRMAQQCSTELAPEI